MTHVDASGPIVLLQEKDLVAVVARGADRAARRDTALRGAVAALTGENPEAIELGAETCPDCGRPHGAPTAMVAGRRIRLSLSHAGEASIAAASIAARVGVDAVDTSRTDHPDPRGWARAEAVLKADGRGLRVAPERIRFAADESASRVSAELDGVTYRVSETVFDTLAIAVAAVTPLTAAPEAAS